MSFPKKNLNLQIIALANKAWNISSFPGLDPAGPYFDNTAKKVRLDETDAVFVDVYHTDVTPLLERGA